MNIYQMYIAGREKIIPVEGDRVEVTRDSVKVFQGTHEIAFFNAAKVEGCTVLHGAAQPTPPSDAAPQSLSGKS